MQKYKLLQVCIVYVAVCSFCGMIQYHRTCRVLCITSSTCEVRPLIKVAAAVAAAHSCGWTFFDLMVLFGVSSSCLCLFLPSCFETVSRYSAPRVSILTTGFPLENMIEPTYWQNVSCMYREERKEMPCLKR